VVDSSRTGLLIIRAWVEDGSGEPLRAHVRITGDVSKGIQRTFTVVTAAEVAEVVDAWLEDVLGAVPATGTPHDA
jgi:hypothetical protein